MFEIETGAKTATRRNLVEIIIFSSEKLSYQLPSKQWKSKFHGVEILFSKVYNEVTLAVLL